MSKSQAEEGSVLKCERTEGFVVYDRAESDKIKCRVCTLMLIHTVVWDKELEHTSQAKPQKGAIKGFHHIKVPETAEDEKTTSRLCRHVLLLNPLRIIRGQTLLYLFYIC